MKQYFPIPLAAILSAWLVALPVVHAAPVSGVTLNWEPHYGTSLKDEGAFIVIAKEAFRRGGHSLSTEYISWTRALQNVENGEDDVVLGAYYTEERNETYFVSDVVYNVDYGIITLDSVGIDKINGLKDLTGYTIGVGRSFANTEEFDQADFLTKEVATGTVQNIRKLFRKRVDMVAGAFDTLGYQARQEGYCADHIVYIQPPLQSHGLYILGSRKTPNGEQLIADFNRGLASMKADGSLQKILEEYLR